MPKLYLFDMDDTLEVSNGPVTLQMMVDLRNEGHIIGLNGNWACFAQRVQGGWWQLISMFNIGVSKAQYMSELRRYILADDYVMVGNIGVTFDAKRFGLIPTGGSDDMSAAADAMPPWRFILEKDFAAGAR